MGGFTRAALPGVGRVARSAVLWALAFSLSIGAPPVHAQWSESNRAGAVADCLPSCERTADPSARHLCPRYCECSVSEAEARYPDFDALNRAAQANSPEIQAVVRQIAQICARRARGG